MKRFSVAYKMEFESAKNYEFPDEACAIAFKDGLISTARLAEIYFEQEPEILVTENSSTPALDLPAPE